MSEVEVISNKILEVKINSLFGSCLIRLYTQRICRLDIKGLKIIKHVSELKVICFLYTVARVDTCDTIGEALFNGGGNTGGLCYDFPLLYFMTPAKCSS